MSMEDESQNDCKPAVRVCVSSVRELLEVDVWFLNNPDSVSFSRTENGCVQNDDERLL